MLLDGAAAPSFHAPAQSFHKVPFTTLQAYTEFGRTQNSLLHFEQKLALALQFR